MTSLDPSNEASMIVKVGNLVAHVMKSPALAGKVTASTDLVNEIGLDSLQMIDFLLALEDEFGIEIDFDSLQIEHLTSVETLCRFVRSLQPVTVPSDAPPVPPLDQTTSEGS